MKACPFCGAAGELRRAVKTGWPFVQCVALRCGAASKPAPTEEAALTNWSAQVRPAEKVPDDWGLHSDISEAA